VDFLRTTRVEPIAELHLVECETCGLSFVAEDFPRDVILGFYQRDVTPEEHFAGREDKHAIFHFILDGFRVPRGRLLDVGSFSGSLMFEARQAGWQVQGVDINRRYVAFCRERLGFEVFLGFLEEANFPDGHFDAVTMIDVLEHLRDPLETLREVRRVLRPGGEVAVSVPNFPFQSLKERIRMRLGRPGGLPAISHLSHFTFESLTMVLERAGFSGVRHAVHPVQIWPRRHSRNGADDLRRRVANTARRSYRALSVMAHSVGLHIAPSLLAFARRLD
jgi:SAM-dependent methyltransferase